MKRQIVIKLLLSTIALLNIRRSESCVCGKSLAQRRIVGGSVAQSNQFPWQVGLMCGSGKKFFLCGGSLINDRYVLTAAHCVANMTAKDIKIVMGKTSLEGQFNKAINPIEIIMFKGYIAPPDDNDIALLKLPKPVTFNESISPICLPEPSMQKFSNLYAAGYGQTPTKDFSTQLLYVEQLTQRDSYCSEKLGTDLFTSKHICANGPKKDLCRGDSGGALVTNSRGVAYAVGIAAWHKSCDNYEYPVVFTRVTSYLQWIREHTKDAKWCTTPKTSNEYPHSRPSVKQHVSKGRPMIRYKFENEI